MLKIGIHNNVYILWGVKSYIKCDHRRTMYTYVRHLDSDLDKAILIAKKKGCFDMKVDHYIKGDKSHVKYQAIENHKGYLDLPANINPYFIFGKLKDSLIVDCIDEKFLYYYYRQTHNRYAKQLLLDIGYVVCDAKLLNQKAALKYNSEANVIKDHFHNEAERVTLELIMYDSYTFQGNYGRCYVKKFKSLDNNYYFYMSNKNIELKNNHLYSITGTIKHQIYKSQKVSKLIRLRINNNE